MKKKIQFLPNYMYIFYKDVVAKLIFTFPTVMYEKYLQYSFMTIRPET